MRTALVALALLTATPVLAQSRAADEAAIRALVDRYTNARTLQDPAQIGALFTPEADQHTTAGEWRRGRDAVVPGTLRSSTNNPGSRAIRVQAVRFLTADAAIVDGPYEITAPSGQVTRNWTTLVVTRAADGWRIAAIRNARPTGQ